MYMVNFQFEQSHWDAEFKRLNSLISAAAEVSDGYLGAEIWISADGRRRNATYYWKSMEALRAFSRHSAHQEAKKQYRRWYKGFHVVVSRIVRSFGDDVFGHITSNERINGDD